MRRQILSRLLALAGLALLAAQPVRADGLPPAIRDWLTQEQVLNTRQVDTTRIVALDNKQDRAYAPESRRVFEVKSYWVDARKVDAFAGAGLDPALRPLFFCRGPGGQQQVRLLVHPESEPLYARLLAGARPAGTFEAMATASSRTLLVWQRGKSQRPFFAKLSLDKEIGGVVRTIPAGEVARSIGFNNVLAASKKTLPSSFRFLPEVVGVMPKGMKRGGMIIRSIPEEILGGSRRYVPLFSLCAPPPEGGPPLLARMIEKSGQPAERFVRERIIRPFVRQFLELAINHGVTSEPHAQNVLLQVGKDGLPTGVFLHRDLGGFNVDFAHRRRIGLPEAKSLPVVSSLSDDYHAGKHRATLENLDYYFYGGFVYNLDRALPNWHKSGFIKNKIKTGTPFKRMLLAEVEGQYKVLTGQRISLGRSFAHIPQKVQQARQHLLQKKMPAQGQKARPRSGLRAMFDAAVGKKNAGTRPRMTRPVQKKHGSRTRTARPARAALLSRTPVRQNRSGARGKPVRTRSR